MARDQTAKETIRKRDGLSGEGRSTRGKSDVQITDPESCSIRRGRLGWQPHHDQRGGSFSQDRFRFGTGIGFVWGCVPRKPLIVRLRKMDHMVVFVAFRAGHTIIQIAWAKMFSGFRSQRFRARVSVGKNQIDMTIGQAG